MRIGCFTFAVDTDRRQSITARFAKRKSDRLTLIEGGAPDQIEHERKLGIPRIQVERSRLKTLGIRRPEPDSLASAMGGPVEYVGHDMKAAHHTLGIRSSEWELFGSHVRAVLERLRVPEAEGRELTDLIADLASDIIGS